jgi:hypothetical protein
MLGQKHWKPDTELNRTHHSWKPNTVIQIGYDDILSL